jgi:hypothetical protein
MDNIDVARRLMFVAATVAGRFKLPQRTAPAVLLEAAMADPEVVTDEEFKAIYWMWKLLKPNQTDE